MKQFYKSLSTLFVFIIVSTFWTSASAVEIDGINYYLNGSEATVTKKSQNDSGYSGDSYTNAYSGIVTIPSSITYNGKTYTVTRIQQSAFNNCPDLITISIPSTVVDISTTPPDIVPDSNSPIDNFSECTSLKAFIVDSKNPYYSAVGGILFDKNKTTLLRCPQTKTGEYTVPSTVKTINSQAFCGCTAITSISLPNSIKSIESAAFYGCTALTSINIPTSLTKLGAGAFYNNFALSSDIIIPSGVTVIPEDAFEECSALTSVTISEGVETIGYKAFYHCSKLKKIVLPSTIRTINTFCFASCNNLNSINIPDGITKIPDSAFRNCNLTSITLPESVKEIGERAFYNNVYITAKLPKTGCSIGDYALNALLFMGNKINIYVYSVPSLTTFTNNSFNKKYTKIHVYASFVEAFKTNGNWKEYDIVGDIPVDNPITSIALDHSSLAMSPYSEGQLTTSIKPDNATLKDVIYTSSNEDAVMILDNTGRFMTLGVGTATITVTAIDGSGVKATCKIVVSDNIIKAESVTLNTTKATINIGDTKTIKATVHPTNATLNYVKWNSSNPDVATVDENGVVTGVSAGTVTITATAADDSGIKATCKVTIKEDIKVESVTLSQKETTIKVGSIQTLTATINPSNATMKSVTWQSSNPKVATVDENGVVTGISAGTATITATAADGSGVKATCKVSVTEEIKVESITLNKKESTIKVGSTQSLTVTINPSNATMKSLTWKSSNPKVATVDEHGVVTGISAGTATITATATDGSGVKTSCKVTIIYNSIALNDASTSYSNNTETTVNPLEYTRTFNNTDWQTLYIPFSMSYDDWKDYFDIARIDGIRLVDKNNDGIIDETILDIVKIEEEVITANTPYLIKPKEIGEKTISISNTILYKSEENSVNYTTNNITFTFIGNYSTISASTLITNNYYTMDGGSLCTTNGSNGLQPFRWYLKVESQGSAYNTTKPIAIHVIGEENASTGIEKSQIMNNKQHIYDLNGRVVNEKVLKTGIYIKNGKKVIIR